MSSSTAPSATSSPATDAPDEPQTDGSKLRTFLGILKKFIGVSDLASVRFSLPSQLLEPTPNLEYWTYLDAPNAFIAIGTSEEPLDRMLEVIRFWLTKDLKYAKGKPCKPYNSCLGEFFRCNWETEDNAPRIETAELNGCVSGSEKGSLRSLKVPPKSDKNESTVSLSVPKHGASTPDKKPIRISYLTEQTSHHPPVSAFHITCPERGLTARGFDQISAKFTGTSVKVLPGEHNMGIFITLDKHGGETYQLTHPAAHLGGLLRGALSVSVSEMAYITCPETKLKCILHYVEEGWLGRTTNKIDGVVFRYDPENDTKTRVQDVPDEDILIRLSGPWREKVVFSLGPKPMKSVSPEHQYTIIDIAPLHVASKILPPEDQQLPNESLTLWGGVTKAIHAKQFSKATDLKVELEEKQREKAREREKNKETWQPVFFEHVVGNGGKPDLTDKGKQVLERAQQGDWSMEGIL
ncbi:Oxysterol-binding protein-like protein 1 [Metarhizium brunneum]|uniref:Oxysterol-binding protein-like protein 1 n=1 Tax=Metarhizium brunneum TaxID=500148 RepID=A0A7D5Z4U5_9HYPO